MKVLYIEARKKASLNLEKLRELEKLLSSKIVIAYSIQYESLANQLKANLSKSIKIISFSQVLGCSNLKSLHPILYIGSGRFHAINLALSSGQEVFIFDNTISKVESAEVEKIKSRERGKYLKFLSSQSIGLIVSTKSGQERFKQAISLKKQFKDKKSYIFLADNINSGELENFSIESWVNTACPDISNDSSILNYDKLKK